LFVAYQSYLLLSGGLKSAVTSWIAANINHTGSTTYFEQKVAALFV
jgi:hypothetical protein